MSENTNQTQKPVVADKIKKAPKKLRRILAIACAAAVIGTAVPLVSMSADAQTAIYATSTVPLNLRKGAGTNYAVIKVISKNDSVTVVDRTNSTWLKVKLSDGTTGYCLGSYLDITTDAKTTTALNLRKGAGTSYSIIKTLNTGVKLDIIKFCNKSWAQVKLSDGTTGYVCTDYISYVANTTSATQASSTTSTKTVSNTATGTSSVKLTVSKTSATLGVGKNVTLTATTTSGGTFTWTSSDNNVATVTSKGVVTAVGEGTATITAKDSKSGKTVTCTVKVVTDTLSSIKLPASSTSLSVGGTYTIKPTTVPANGNVEYTTSNKSVATVTSAGVVTAVGAGTAKITVSDPEGSVSSVLTVTVTSPLKISLSKSSVSVQVGANYTLKATTSDNSSVKWTSSDTTVASVRGGIVSGLKAGTATITATDSTGKLKATCKVTVTAVSSTGVSLSRYTASTTAGKTIYIKGYSTYSASWGSSDSNIATVKDGFILTKNPGKAAITYTDSYGRRAVCVVTVYDADPIKFTYSSPNSAVLNSDVKLVAITDKTRTKVKFVVNVNGKNVTVNATEKKTDGNTYVWTGTYKTTVAGTLTYKAYSYKNSAWSTSSDGEADIYVTTKTDAKTTSTDRLRASDEVIKFIGEKEGFVSQITYDTLANNIPTLGYGYVVWEGWTFYDNLTKNEAYALLVSAVNKEVYASRVNDMLTSNNVRLNQQQFDALVSFSYNLGTGWTSSSDLKTILLNAYAPATDSSTVTATVDAIGGLNLRKSYTTSSDVITVLSNGQKVTLVSTTKYNGVWYKVKTADGKTGYCSGTYLNLNYGTSSVRDLTYVNKNALITEMLAYHHAGGVCYYGLLYRRADELEMFLYGDYVSDGYKNTHNFPSPYCLSF